MCLTISVAIWGLIKLSQKYQESIYVELSFYNQPNHTAIAVPENPVFQVFLEAEGFQLLLWKWRIYKPVLSIDLSKIPRLIALTDTVSETALPSMQVFKSMTGESRLPDIITKVFPETIDFQISKRQSKMIAVKPEIELVLDEQHRLYEAVKSSPDSILVSGSYKELSELSVIYTEPLRFENITEGFSVKAKLLNPLERNGLMLSRKTVELTTVIERYTEAKVDVPITIADRHSSFKIRTLPDFVSVYYLVALKDYKDIKADDFVVEVNFNNQKDTMITTLRAEIAKQPEKVVVSRIVPAEVDFFLIKQ